MGVFRASRRLSKNPWRAREGLSPLEFQSYPAACTPAEVLFANSLAKSSRFATEWLILSHSPLRVIFESGNPISQSKNHFIAVFAPGNPKDFSENWRGWQWRGSLLPRPPACQNTILTSSAPGIAPGAFFRGGDSRNRLPRPDAWRGKPGVEKQLRRMCRLNSRNRRADRLYLGAQCDTIFSKTS